MVISGTERPADVGLILYGLGNYGCHQAAPNAVMNVVIRNLLIEDYTAWFHGYGPCVMIFCPPVSARCLSLQVCRSLQRSVSVPFLEQLSMGM